MIIEGEKSVEDLINEVGKYESGEEEDIEKVRRETLDALETAQRYLALTVEGNTAEGFWRTMVTDRASDLVVAWEHYVEDSEGGEEGESAGVDPPSVTNEEGRNLYGEWGEAMTALLTVAPPVKFESTPELAANYAENIKRNYRSISDQTKTIASRLSTHEADLTQAEKRLHKVEKDAKALFEQANSRIGKAESEIKESLQGTVETQFNEWYEAYKQSSEEEFEELKKESVSSFEELIKTKGDEFANRVLKLGNEAKEARAKIDGIAESATGNFREVVRQIGEENEKLRDKTMIQVETLLSQLQKDVESSGKTVAALAGQVMSDGFKERADKAENSVRIGYLIVAALIGFGAWYGKTIFDDLSTSDKVLDAYLLVWRTLAFGAMGFALLLAQQAIKRYSAIADTNSRLHLEMLALEPFVRALKDEDEKKLRARVADTTFGHALIEDRELLGRTLVETIDKSRKRRKARQEEKNDDDVGNAESESEIEESIETA